VWALKKYESTRLRNSKVYGQWRCGDSGGTTGYGWQLPLENAPLENAPLSLTTDCDALKVRTLIDVTLIIQGTYTGDAQNYFRQPLSDLLHAWHL